ncbi:Chromosome partition protein Smc [Pseudoclavibacter triregionum]|nr:Chromosome partition protein Smc [Pseudoclavibacter triregionum]
MHLKSLTLKGFKSFANPTTLLFEPGVTCVVGPNGSGKSNVVDALAWVMGEQGAKSLRGGKMEDVIFAGTSTRGPLGRAEVALTIDNADGALPIDYAEVTIRRTLFRSGGSEYAINGEPVRLLDVQELLSDTGLGREMHVIVGQGRLDSVLHATPEERRGFIEEAAGILKHRRRKEKTVRKLEGMEHNLTRLRDLATEVRRQLKPLGRQAEVARRAQGIAAIVRDAKARLMADDVVELRRALQVAGRTEQERSTERMVLQEKLQQAVVRAERIVAEQRGDRVDGARRVAFELESALERLRNLEQLAGQRRALLEQRLEQPAREVTVAPDAVEQALAEAELLRGRAAEAEAAWRAAQDATAAARAALDAVDEEIAAQSALISRHDLEASQLQGAADAAASRLAAVRGEVLRQRNARDAAAQRLADGETALAELDASSSAGEAESGELDAAYQAAEIAVTDAEVDLEAVRERLHELERERDALEAREQALGLAAEVQDGTGALLAAKLDGVDGLVAERIAVDEGYETAIAAALGQLADAILAESAEAAIAVLERAREGELGRVEVVAPFSAPEAAARAGSSAKLPPGEVAAASVVRAPTPVEALLAGTVVVETLDDARALLAADDAPPRVVTRAGESLTASSAAGGTGTSGQSRIELLAERDRASARLAEVRAEIDEASLQRGERRAELEAAKSAQAQALEGLRAFDAELASRREALHRATSRVESARAELARAAKALELAESGVADAEAKAEAAKRALEVHRSTPRPLLEPGRRDEQLEALEAAREAEVEARLGLETLRERVRAETLRAEQLAERLEAERAAADRAARETVLRRAELDRTLGVLGALPQVIRLAAASLDEAKDALRDAERERESQNEELARLRGQESELRGRLAEITDDVHNLELQIYEKKLQLSSLLERAASELSLTEAILVDEYGPDRLVPDDDETLRSIAERAAAVTAESSAIRRALEEAEGDEERDGLEREFERALRERLEEAGEGDDAEAAADADADAERSPDDDGAEPADPAGVPYERVAQQRRLAEAERMMAQLGRINPLALEEFAALEQRHAFLAEQLDDLERTRRDLMKIVADIDERMKTVFAEAFEDTREAFHTVFPILFPGGAGDIRLTAPDDLLTTGIEVSVKPAGKKIERLSLLSGGERSLAAVALLIAIFKARPSPFYIMDEVEAALDDANLGRLLEVFQDLRASSQLIVITHQKRTMEIADALYGVSMRQDGVSAVVGQRIADEAPGEAPRERPSAVQDQPRG